MSRTVLMGQAQLHPAQDDLGAHASSLSRVRARCGLEAGRLQGAGEFGKFEEPARGHHVGHARVGEAVGVVNHTPIPVGLGLLG